MKLKSLATATLVVLALGSVSATWTNVEARSNRRGRWNSTNAMVQAGTAFNVRLGSNISTDDTQSGSAWSGTVDQSVGSIPAGSPVTGVVTSSSQGTHSSRAALTLAVREVTVNGRTYAMNANTQPIVAGTQRAKKIGAIVGGAAVGALLGNAIGGGKGAVIGGLAGGGAGYGLTRNALRTLQLKPGTVVMFTTSEAVLAQR